VQHRAIACTGAVNGFMAHSKGRRSLCQRTQSLVTRRCASITSEKTLDFSL